MSVEILAFRTNAHGVDAEAYLLQGFLSIEVFSPPVVGHEFFLTQLIEVLHDGKIRGAFDAVIGAVGDAEAGIELGKQDFNGVDLCI